MNEQLYKKILDGTKYGIYYVDISRKIMFWNKAAEDITGFQAAEVTGRFCHNSGLQHTDMQGNLLCHINCPLFLALGDGSIREHDVLLRTKDGRYIPVTTSVIPVYDEDGRTIIGAVETFYPLDTERDEDVSFDSFIDGLITASGTDTLTGLPNRRSLESYLEHQLERYLRYREPFGVLFADIDNFWQFNDTYGHDAGDAVLINLAEVFRSGTRKGDMLGRWGGEEFLGVFRFRNDEEAYKFGERLRRDVEHMDVDYNDKKFHVTISAGLTMIRTADDADSIINRADELMYRSKKNGKNQLTTDQS